MKPLTPISETQFWAHWVEGQRQGFAGKLTRHKLADGSKMVAIQDGNLLYTDRWYGSDLGGGQTLMHYLTGAWDPERPSEITGMPLARMGYQGQIVIRLPSQLFDQTNSEASEESQSDHILKFLKQALSKVSIERPFRGPQLFASPQFPGLVYTSDERRSRGYMTGDEWIRLGGGACLFEGSYHFTFIQKNLEDCLLT